MLYVFYLILITQVFSKILLQRPIKILNSNVNNNVGIIVFAGYGKKASSYKLPYKNRYNKMIHEE